MTELTTTTPQYQVSAPSTFGVINTANTGVWRDVSDSSGSIGILWASDSEPRAGFLGDPAHESVRAILALLRSGYGLGFSPLKMFDTLPYEQSMKELTFGEVTEGELSEISDDRPLAVNEGQFFALFDDSIDEEDPKFIGLFAESMGKTVARDEGTWIPVGENRGFYENNPISVDVTEEFVDLFDRLNSRGTPPLYSQIDPYIDQTPSDKDQEEAE